MKSSVITGKVGAKAKAKANRKIIKRCHVCGQVSESANEIDKCISCGKSFLPLNYFAKVHDQKGQDYNYADLYAGSHELEDEDLIIGLYVLW